MRAELTKQPVTGEGARRVSRHLRAQLGREGEGHEVAVCLRSEAPSWNVLSSLYRNIINSDKKPINSLGHTLNS